MIIRIRGIPTETRHLALHVLAKRPLGETSLQNPSGSVFAISPSTQLSLAANGMADGHRKKWEKHEKPRTRVKRTTILMATCRKWGLKPSFFFCFLFFKAKPYSAQESLFWSWHITWNWWLKSWLGVPGDWFNGYRGNRLGFYSLINKSRFLKETGRFFTAIYSYDMFICSPRCSPTPSMRMVDAPATTWGWSHCASKLWRILVGWHCRLMRRTSMSGPDFFEQKTSNNSCPCWEKPQIYTPMDEIS